MTRRICRLQILTDLPASRLAPSGLRPNALPLHNVRDRGPEGTAEDRILLTGHSAFVTPSAHALNETDKLHRKGQERFNLLDTSSGPCGPNLVEPDGIEPTTSCLQSTRSPN